MTSQKDMVAAYFEGFRTTDRELILGLLTDDVAWDLPGYKHLVGKDAFNEEIVGEAPLEGGGTHRFTFCDVFTFRDDRIARVESYLVALGGNEVEQG